MINDYKELYNLKLINNYGIFFGIVIAIFITKTIFSANNKILKK